MRILSFAAFAAGCAQSHDLTNATLSVDGVTGISVDLERGDAALAGTLPAEFDLAVDAWGRGLTRGLAKGAAKKSKVTFRVRDQLLELIGRSDAPTAGVDFDLKGPSDLSVDAILQHGALTLVDLRGDLIVEADTVSARGVSGALDLTATSGGVDLDARPEPGDSIRIDAAGDTVLSLPFGGEYRLQVFSDPDFPGEVADLGFDQLAVAPDYTSGVTGSGSVDVTVVVRGGSFALRPSDPSESSAGESSLEP